MSEQKPLYELIKENIVDGKLKENFSLPSDSYKGEIRFVDGAMDGICVYHMTPYELKQEDNELLERIIVALAKGDYEKTNLLLAELGKNARAIQIVDKFQACILKHSDEIDFRIAYPCIFDIVCRSTEKESIKFALEIMELLDTEQDFIKNVVRTIALSDEFSIFAAWIMRGWENGNNELFELAKNVKGWGRIHTIELLSPDTDEIREWLFTEGTKNDIMNAYSALTCWEKSGAEERLKGELTYQEYQGVLTLIEALLDEGPVFGISKINNADQIISDVVKRADNYSIDIDDYELFLALKNWAEQDDEVHSLTLKACNILLSSERCVSTVKTAIESGKETRLAKYLGIQ